MTAFGNTAAMGRAGRDGAWSESEILASMADALFVVDAGWRLAFVNAEAARLVQRSADTLLGRRIWDVYPELRETPVEAEFTRAKRERCAVSVVNHYEPLDTWFSLRASPLRDGLLIAFHDISEHKRTEQLAQRLAAEQAALHRIAEIVARQAAPEELFGHVAQEAAALQDVEGAAVVRFAGPGQLEVVGRWSQHGADAVNSRGVYEDHGAFEELHRARGPVVLRSDEGTLTPAPRDHGRQALLQLPIAVEGQPWGALVLSSIRPEAFDEHAVERQRQFADLLSVAIGNALARDRLARMAATDPVSGLANHRVFHERLREEIAEAGRRRRPLSVAVLGLDRFRDVNDMHGHLAGDAILTEVGERLLAVAQPGELLARIGGDEFAMIMPGQTPEQAAATIERAREAVAQEPFGPERATLTISAGVADLASAGHGELLFACADGALYWSKLNGRDVVCTFRPEMMDELSPADRAEALVRGQTLAGITALARAIDAKDPMTRRHSERVAWLAELLARECGWSEPQIRALHEAALVHDVGKIGIPDEILLHDGTLTDAQYALVKQHAALGAEIVEGVLRPEQVEWVRSHHERPDGRGYPEALTAERISEGAALLSVADVLDVMTISRPYSRPIPLADAVAECEQLVGSQFLPAPVAALRRLFEAGALREWQVPPGRRGC